MVAPASAAFVAWTALRLGGDQTTIAVLTGHGLKAADKIGELIGRG